MEWLKYSKKEVCELCSHKYSFQPIYRTDMPKTLPISEIVRGVIVNFTRVLRSWAVYTLVLVAWLGVVPVTACRVYRFVFSASFNNILQLPLQMFSMDNLVLDAVKGCFIVSMFLCAFISLVWLREQILHGGPQEWLILENPNEADNADASADAAADNYEDAEDGHDEAADENNGNNNQEGDGAQEQGENDNWREWERVADELTWQRLLGLDGSLLFLEHVFWVISLNTLFTILFAYSPYHIGQMLLKNLGLAESIKYFPTLTSVFLGYVVISFLTRLAHMTAKYFGFARIYRFLGLMYLVLKVFLLVLVEIGFFPVVCGWWLDICSLPLFASTITRRLSSFTESPTSSLFLHWLIGMVYVFYSASFVLVLREVLRPGVLWFLRNLNDPEFNPIQEMIEFPVIRHMRRLVASTSIFVTTILLVVYFPLCFVSKFIPSVLPFNLNLAAETPITELSIELLVLQFVLPAILEQTHARAILKVAVRAWCRLFGRLLKLENYLLPGDGNEHEARPAEPAPAEPANARLALAAQHQALLLVREPQGVQAYVRPPYFPLRIAALLVALSLTSMIASVFLCVVPVTFGRFIVYNLSGNTNIHELYTMAAGLYACWILLKLLHLVIEYAPLGVHYVLSACRTGAITIVKLLAVAFPILLVIPLLVGIYFHLAVVTPFRIAAHQTPLLFYWQHWAMGVLHCKIICAGIMMGPDWWMKQLFEQLYANGIRNLRVGHLYAELVAPVLALLGLLLSAPRVLAPVLSLFIEVSEEERIMFVRSLYPTMTLCMFSVHFVWWQYKKLRALAEKIRNDKYLVGTQLVNYEREHGMKQ